MLTKNHYENMRINYRQQCSQNIGRVRIFAVPLGALVVIGVMLGIGALTPWAQNIYTLLHHGVFGVHTVTENVYMRTVSKQELLQENKALKEQMQALQVQAFYNTVLRQENDALRMMIDASVGTSTDAEQQHIARIVQYNAIPYGTILISFPSNIAVHTGDIVHFGSFVLGTITRHTNTTAVVHLFTASGSALDVFVGETQATFTGTSNGTGKIMLPRDISITKGMPVSVPSAQGRIIGVVQDIHTEDASALQTIRVGLPVNIAQLRFVTISTR